MEDPLYIVDRGDAVFAQRDGKGTELTDDMLIRLDQPSTVLFSAPHACEHYRRDEGVTTAKPAEGPTGGMVFYLSVEHDFACLAMRGGQTGDPNHNSDHPYKDYVEQHAQQGGVALFDIHGLAEDSKPEFDITIGLGGLPGIGEGFLARLCRDVLGPMYGFNVGHTRYTAINPNCITTHAQHHGLVALQLELKPPLRYGEDRDARLNALMFLRDLGMAAAEYLPGLLKLEGNLNQGIRELLQVRGPLVSVP